MNKGILRFFIAVFVFVAIATVIVTSKSQAPVKQVQQSTTQSPRPTTFDKAQFSTSDPASIWIVVNKARPLEPRQYIPNGLVSPNVPMRAAGTVVRSDLAKPMESLFAAAQANNTPLRLSSGYRSYVYQTGLYNGYVAKQGQAVADSESARPGYSEHQTGLAADIAPASGTCEVLECFAETPAGQWIAANAYKYGFIIRYGKNLTETTGYAYEPWHIRYVGVSLATEMHNKNVPTLERFFGLPDAPTYTAN